MAPREARRKLVILESPYSGDIQRNVTYAELAMWDSIGRGEAPFASHLLYPGILDETDPAQRALGIQCGYAWLRAAELQVFYTDRGWSKGMTMAMRMGLHFGVPQEFRDILGHGHKPPTEYTL